MNYPDKNILALAILAIVILLLPLLIKNSSLFQEKALAAPIETLNLDKPLSIVNVDLVEALKLRKSTKEFADYRISPQELSTILWAANGINRKDGKRTAPSAYGKYFVEIYVASDQGVYRYEPVKHQLHMVSSEDIKSKVASAKFVGTASHVLLFIANLNEFPFFVKSSERIAGANATAGCIGENVYLMTGALKLGTCLMSSIDQKFIQENLKLNANQIPLFIMPIGLPK